MEVSLNREGAAAEAENDASDTVKVSPLPCPQSGQNLTLSSTEEKRERENVCVSERELSIIQSLLLMDFVVRVCCFNTCRTRSYHSWSKTPWSKYYFLFLSKIFERIMTAKSQGKKPWAKRSGWSLQGFGLAGLAMGHICSCWARQTCRGLGKKTTPQVMKCALSLHTT